VELDCRYALYMSCIAVCNTCCALAGQYYNEQLETTALRGSPISSRCCSSSSSSGYHKVTLRTSPCIILCVFNLSKHSC
jgi:hypothetical protein